MIFNELSRFVTYFNSLSLPYETAHGALLWACDLYQVEKSKTHILLTELKSNQKNPSKMFTDHEVLVQSLQKRSNRLCKLGFSDMTLIVGCSIKYIDSDLTLRNILAVSKDFNDILIQEVLKQSLLRTDQHRIQRKRKTLWLKLLKIDPQYIIPEFQVYQQQSLLDLPTRVQNDIEVDIHRSFKNNEHIQDENLRRILYTYAVVNPALDYCQGMNFIAGFLYLFLQDEALSFAVLREIINQFDLSTLFNTELPMLKLNFYRLDRLISILLPDLHGHFKVSCEIYATYCCFCRRNL